MDQVVNLPSRTQGDRKDLSPRPSRAVKRMAPPPENLVRRPRKNIYPTAVPPGRWEDALTRFIFLQQPP